MKPPVRNVSLTVLDHPDERPQTRGDCKGGERPCPWLSCKFHMLLDVNKHASIHINMDGRPRLKLADQHAGHEAFDEAALERLMTMPETCALDVADQGGVGVTRCGEMLAMDKQMVDFIEVDATRKIARSRLGRTTLKTFAEEE
jgi:hypothetical protein